MEGVQCNDGEVSAEEYAAIFDEDLDSLDSWTLELTSADRADGQQIFQTDSTDLQPVHVHPTHSNPPADACKEQLPLSTGGGLLKVKLRRNKLSHSGPQVGEKQQLPQADSQGGFESEILVGSPAASAELLCPPVSAPKAAATATPPAKTTPSATSDVATSAATAATACRGKPRVGGATPRRWRRRRRRSQYRQQSGVTAAKAKFTVAPWGREAAPSRRQVGEDASSSSSSSRAAVLRIRCPEAGCCGGREFDSLRDLKLHLLKPPTSEPPEPVVTVSIETTASTDGSAVFRVCHNQQQQQQQQAFPAFVQKQLQGPLMVQQQQHLQGLLPPKI